MMRGANEGVLTLDIGPDPETGLPQVEAMVAAALGVAGGAPRRPLARGRRALGLAQSKLGLSMMLDLLGQLRERAQDEAIRVFARNLNDLLLAAPAGAARRRWASTRACAPASRSRWSTRPASCSRPTPSIRSSRGTTCAAPRPRSPR